MLVCALFTTIAHETAGAARIRHSLRPLTSRGRENYLQTSGAVRRENANIHSTVIARLDRATQYPRDADDRTEKPRRTGSPAFAGDDSCVRSGTAPACAGDDSGTWSGDIVMSGLAAFAKSSAAERVRGPGKPWRRLDPGTASPPP